jgi:Mg2+ and Co2+ transporter CorA
MHQEQHHRYYRRWHDVLQIDALYGEVSQEVREMHDYLQLHLERERVRQAEELNKVVLFLTSATVVFTPLAIVVSGLGMNLSVIEKWDQGWGDYGWVWVCAGAFMVGVVWVGLGRWWLKRATRANPICCPNDEVYS